MLIAGDQEYRSEESIPALAQILAVRHGFHCTVLFSVNRQTGQIDPNTIDNIPGLEALRRADLVVLFARWLELPDEQMKEIIDYTDSGRPIVALRTSTHPFNYQKHPESPYAKYSYNNKQFSGGYGRQVLGETWIAHYGAHQKQSTRGVIAAGMEKHPILRGVRDLWGESDVYEISALSGDSQPLVMGQVLMSMDPASSPDPSKKPMPVAWTKTYTGTFGQARPYLHHHDGSRHGFPQRRLPAHDGQRLLLGGGAGEEDLRDAQRGIRRSLQSSPDRRTPHLAVTVYAQVQLFRRPFRHRSGSRRYQRA